MRQLQGHECSVRALAYAPDGRLLVSGDDGGRVGLWSLPAGELLQFSDVGHGSIEALGLSPRGEFLAIAMPDAVFWLDVGRSLQNEDAEVVGVSQESGTRALAWHPVENLLVTGGWGARVHFWTSTAAQRRDPLPFPAPITALTFTADGKSLALVGTSGLVRVLDATSWRPRWQTKQPRGSYALACSRGNLLATGETNGDILLWNLQDGARAHQLSGHTWTIYGLAFTPDGEHLVSGSADGTVRLWDTTTGRERETFRWHSKWVTSVAISPDGMTAAAASADATIVVWDLADA